MTADEDRRRVGDALIAAGTTVALLTGRVATAWAFSDTGRTTRVVASRISSVRLDAPTDYFGKPLVSCVIGSASSPQGWGQCGTT